MDLGAWWAAVHGVAKSRTRLSDFTFTFHFHALEKEMATHSSVLAWRVPGTGESGGLPSMGSHRVGTRLKRLSSSSILVGWHHQLNGHEFEQALGVGDGQGGLVCYSPWGHKKLDTTEQLN